jgi:hypothetical protein
VGRDAVRETSSGGNREAPAKRLTQTDAGAVDLSWSVEGGTVAPRFGPGRAISRRQKSFEPDGLKVSVGGGDATLAGQPSWQRRGSGSAAAGHRESYPTPRPHRMTLGQRSLLALRVSSPPSTDQVQPQPTALQSWAAARDGAYNSRSMILLGLSCRNARRTRSLLALCVTCMMAGCGSGPSPTYDQSQFGTCLRSSGATVAHLQGHRDGKASDKSLFSSHLPNAGSANFLDASDGTTVGEFVYFYAPSDGALARAATSWLKGLHEYSVSRSGNLVVATNPSPSSSLEKLITQCRNRARTS